MIITPDFGAPKVKRLTRKKKAQVARSRARQAEPRTLVERASSGKLVKLELANDRDSLTRLHHRGVLTRREYRAGETYRKAYSADTSAGAAIQSGINALGMPQGGRGGDGQAEVITATEAKQTLFWLRWVVLGGQADAVGVMDAVCGKGLSLAEISRGNDRIAGKLETALRIALGQCATALEQKQNGKVRQAS